MADALGFIYRPDCIVFPFQIFLRGIVSIDRRTAEVDQARKRLDRLLKFLDAGPSEILILHLRQNRVHAQNAVALE